jgi:hypothetical protein
MFRVEDDVLGGKPTSSTQDRYERLATSIARERVACPCSSKAITTTAAP